MTNPNKLLKLSLAALALTSLSALANTGNEPVNIESEFVRAISSEQVGTAAQIHQQQPKHRLLLNKEVREPRSNQ